MRTTKLAAVAAVAIAAAPLAAAEAARTPSGSEKSAILRATGKSERSCGSTRVKVSSRSGSYAAAYVRSSYYGECRGTVVYARKSGSRWARTSAVPSSIRTELKKAVS
jgi:hypothetical protein